MRKILILLGIVAVASAAIGYYLYNMPPKNLSHVRADVEISANVLMSSFEDNEESANSAYLGKVIEVTGKISNVDIKDDGSVELILESESLLGGISCNFNLEDISEFKTALQEGQDAIVKGKCSGYLLDVILERCVVVNLIE